MFDEPIRKPTPSAPAAAAAGAVGAAVAAGANGGAARAAGAARPDPAHRKPFKVTTIFLQYSPKINESSFFHRFVFKVLFTLRESQFKLCYHCEILEFTLPIIISYHFFT